MADTNKRLLPNGRRADDYKLIETVEQLRAAERRQQGLCISLAQGLRRVEKQRDEADRRCAEMWVRLELMKLGRDGTKQTTR